jgi:hypothetical protein
MDRSTTSSARLCPHTQLCVEIMIPTTATTYINIVSTLLLVTYLISAYAN